MTKIRIPKKITSYNKDSKIRKDYERFLDNNLSIEPFLFELFKKYNSRERRYMTDITDLFFTDKKLSQYLLGQTLFLDNVYLHVSISQRVFHLFFNDYDLKICKYCNAPAMYNKNNTITLDYNSNYLKTCNSKECIELQKKNSLKENIQQKYGVKNISQTQIWKDKIKQTNIENYGVEWHVQSQDFKDKFKKTNLEKRAVEHHLKTKESMDKQRETNLKRYGVASLLEDQILKEYTMFKKYGVEYPQQSNKIQEKTKQTNLKKYGAEWITQTEMCQYHNNNWKWYTLPSGKKIHVQGYENIFLDEYFLEGGQEENILISQKDIENKIGKIWYYTEDNKKHRYFPDFYLINENTIIEVKSNWTYKSNYNINILKQNKCLEIGLNFIFKIYK